MKTAFARAKPAKGKGCRKSRIGPKDLEACLYPLIQREAAKDAPANCWEIYVNAEDASALTLGLVARFAFDAAEHLSSQDPRFKADFPDELTVIASIDRSLKPGDLRAQASLLDPAALASHRAKAAVTKRGIATRAAPSREPTLFTAKAKAAGSRSGGGTYAAGKTHAATKAFNEGDETMGIKKFFSELTGKGASSPTAMSNRWASPDDIIQSTLAEIDDKAMNWPDGKDLPDRVIVYLSQADYARYGPRKSASEQHIANKILDYAQECGALLERNPSVTLKVDPLLYCGQMRIDASFTDPATAPAGASGTANAGARTAGAAGGPLTNSQFAGAGALTFPTQGMNRPARPNAMTTPEFRPSEGMRTPEFRPDAGSDCSIAKLTGSSFQSAVLAGDTIGRFRSNDRPKPNISLDGPDFEFVSQEQGTFEHDRDGWWFISVGRNGTSVQRKGSWTKLTHGVRFALEDGDSISFGKCTPLTFSIAQ